MQQRQLRLGDILDDYCPRERRVTNHAVVAMVGEDVKQTRCTTCDSEHEYKHAKVPRQRRKNETPAALYAHVAAGAPKRVTHEQEASETQADPVDPTDSVTPEGDEFVEIQESEPVLAAASVEEDKPVQQAASEPEEPNGQEPSDDDERADAVDEGEGPIHRRLIRASLPRPEGQQPPARPIPEFTIRQPGGGRNRFRPRHQRGQQQGQFGHQFGGNRNNGGGLSRGNRHGGGGGGMNRRGHGGGGRKRSK